MADSNQRISSLFTAQDYPIHFQSLDIFNYHQVYPLVASVQYTERPDRMLLAAQKP